MKIQSSWDDGKKEDLRIAKLLKSYQLNGIFFLPNKGLELSQGEIKELSNDFEIGGHTFSHPMDLKLLSEIEQKVEIELNKDFLEHITGKKIEWFCYPRGRYNEITIKILKEIGIKYARTTLVGNTKKPEDNYRIATSVHVHPSRTEYKGQDWLEYAKEKFNVAKKEDGVFHIWGHGREVSKFNLWNDLKELFRYIQTNKM